MKKDIEKQLNSIVLGRGRFGKFAKLSGRRNSTFLPWHDSAASVIVSLVLSFAVKGKYIDVDELISILNKCGHPQLQNSLGALSSLLNPSPSGKRLAQLHLYDVEDVGKNLLVPSREFMSMIKDNLRNKIIKLKKIKGKSESIAQANNIQKEIDFCKKFVVELEEVSYNKTVTKFLTLL